MPDPISDKIKITSVPNPLDQKLPAYSPSVVKSSTNQANGASATPSQSARQTGSLYASAKSEADYPRQELLNLVKKFINYTSLVPGLRQEILKQEELIINCYPEIKDKLSIEMSKVSQEYDGNQNVINAHREYVLMNSCAVNLTQVARENIIAVYKNIPNYNNSQFQRIENNTSNEEDSELAEFLLDLFPQNESNVRT